MFQSLLKNLAKKYLGLVEKEEGTSLTVARQTEELVLFEEKLASLQADNKQLMLLCGEMKNRYPEVWLDGDVADGLVRLPKLNMAVEFYREENRLCVVIPFEKAAGKNPLEFIPSFLEKDPALEIEGIRDKMNSTVFIYKIPILGWNDALEMTKNIQDEQPNYELDGSIRDKPKSFRARCGVQGVMRRVLKGGKTTITMWFMGDDLPDPNRYSFDQLLPKGNLEIVPGTSRRDSYSAPDLTYWFECQVKETPATLIESDHEIKVLPAGGAGK
jgi:hypothetical protein